MRFQLTSLPYNLGLLAIFGGVAALVLLSRGTTVLLPLTLLLVAGALVHLLHRLRLARLRATAAEGRLRVAENDASVGVFEIDVQQDSLLASGSFWQLLGRPAIAGPVSLSEWLRVLHPSEVAAARELLTSSTSSLRREIEHRVLLPDGESRWVLTRVSGDGTDGPAQRIRGVTVDITERRLATLELTRTQRELRQQVEDLRELHELSARLESLDDLPAQLGEILGTLVRVHGGCGGLVMLCTDDAKLQLVAHEGLGEPASRGLDGLPVTAGALALCCEEARRVIVEDTQVDPRFEAHRALAAKERFRSVHSTPLFDHAGRLLGALNVLVRDSRAITDRELRLSDICARKAAVFIERARAQALARQGAERFQCVLDASAAGFLTLRPVRDAFGLIRDFSVSYANPAAIAHLGPSLPATLPPFFCEGNLFDTWVSVARDGSAVEFELQVPGPAGHDDEGEWFQVIASRLEDDVAVWFTSVTHRRRHEKELEEADRRKDEFLATLAHELRNPLAPIRQATQIAMAPRANEAQKRWSYAVIERQVQHMSLLLDDLLDISRITRGQLRLRRQPCELRAVFHAALEAARPLIESRHHTLELDLPASDVPLEADPLRLSQILSNLLTNAAKYTNPHGQIRASATVHGRDLLIAVEDNGIGLEAGALEHIFNMFSQVASAQERSEGGLGIGLALTRGLVRLHGGSIQASSEGPGLGSLFTVRMPVVAVAQDARAACGIGASSMRGVRAMTRRLVIADDNRDAAESLAMLMRLEGHEVHLAHDGHAALQALIDHKPEFALLDIGMPGLTGYEIARAARARPELQGTRLVAITGWGQASDKARALEEGFDIHMTKPVDVDRLLALLQADADIERHRA